MFHVKHLRRRTLAFVCGLALLGVLVASCASLAASARGWARPVSVDNVYLVSTSRGKLTAIDKTSLTSQWVFPTDWQISPKGADKLQGVYGAPIVASDGDTVFLGDYNGYIYAFKASQAPTAQQIQSGTKPNAAAYKLNGPVIGGLVLDEASSTLYVAAGDTLYAINSADLLKRIDTPTTPVQIRWTFSAGRDIWSAPVRVDGGKIITASLDGKIYAVDEATGHEAWSFDAGSGLVSQPVAFGDKVLVGSLNSNLYAVNMADGSKAWSFKATDWVWSKPLIENSSIYFGDFKGNLFAVNPSDGSLLWRVDIGHGSIIAAPVISGNTIIVGTVDGWLAGYDTQSHDKLWEQKVGTDIEADPAVIDNKVIIAPRGCVTPKGATEKTYYIAVDPQSGELTSAAGVC